jgi:cell division protein FtsW (lipid II flippase)
VLALRQSEREDAFLDAVCAEVRWKSAHAAIREELMDHVEDQETALQQTGMPQDKAEQEALSRLGDPQALGMLFDASFRPAPTLGVLLPIVLYALLGILLRTVLYTMSGAHAWLWFMIAVLFGIIGIALAFRLNLFRVAHRAWIAYGFFLCAVIFFPALVPTLAGQMPEESAAYPLLRYVWLLFPLVYGLLLYRLRGLGFFGVLAALFLLGVPLMLCTRLFWSGLYLESLASFACVGMLLLAIHSGFFACKKWVAICAVLLFVLILAMVLLVVEPYRMSRFLAVLNPARDPMGDGWIVLRMREMFSHAALVGEGSALPTAAQEIVDRFGESTMSQSVLLAMIAYRYGLVVAALPVFGLVAWIIFGIRRIKTLGSSLGKLLAFGVLLVFAAQAVFSGAAFLGYPLWYSAVFPFLSDDTMAYLMNLLLAGLLVSLLRTDGLFHDTSFQNKKLRLRLE